MSDEGSLEVLGFKGRYAFLEGRSGATDDSGSGVDDERGVSNDDGDGRTRPLGVRVRSACAEQDHLRFHLGLRQITAPQQDQQTDQRQPQYLNH
jgi:hypothetical protein